jgi:hypothetical protein
MFCKRTHWFLLPVTTRVTGSNNVCPSNNTELFTNHSKHKRNRDVKSPQYLVVLVINAPTVFYTFIVTGNTFSILITVDGLLPLVACGRRGRR